MSPRAGRLVPYGGNPWRLEDPDFLALCDGIEEVAANISQFSSAARRTAEERFSLTHMVDTYIDVFPLSYGRFRLYGPGSLHDGSYHE